MECPPARRCSIQHFTTFRAFEQAERPRADFCFLDDFLDEDQTYGTRLVAHIDCEWFVGFSSLPETTAALRQAALESGRWTADRAVCFVRDTSRLDNPPLSRFFRTS